ncbi:MAG: hypothetical protein Q8K70_02020 [Bacteroidota bacterium]|nr:hypothetical protein [Bacteroidota bacterium]
MNPEEFDRRLKKAFNKENLQPKEDLWEHIASKIEPKQKKGIWFYILPVIATLFTIGAIAYFYDSNNNHKQILATENNESILAETLASKEEKNIISSNTSNEKIDKSDNFDIEKTTNKRSKNKSNKSQLTDTKSIKKISNWNYPITPIENKSISLKPIESDVNSSKIDLNIFSITKINFRKTVFFPEFFKDKLPKEPIAKNLNPNKTKSNDDSKWSFIIGMGPQLAINQINLPQDKKDYVHKELWNNKNQLTHNGTGFQSHLLLNFKPSKIFSFETGLSYGIRTEDIKLDVSSDEIAARNSEKKILLYNKIKLLVIVYTDSTQDSTFYDAISSFNLAVNNKYHTLTLPINIKSEFMLTDNTGISFGLGGGISYLYAKKSIHYDIINEKKIEQKKQSFITSSFNTRVSLFTNFNDIGKIGIYAGFQFYSKPWQVTDKQYSIGMRDLQLGIMFQKPLNW